MKISSIHIVRRFGTVGGMENYVFELTHALSRQNHSVLVLCEINESKNTDPSIKVIPLGRRLKKPRWLAQLNFSNRVSKYLELNPPSSNTVIHSHERTANHHVTTFHGPPFLNRKKRTLDFLSPRISTWTKLEKRELQGEQVQAILPNSHLISDQLKTLYPSIQHKILEPAYPGVSDLYSKIKNNSNGKTIGFIGKEWKRKGLDFVCEVFKKLRETDPDTHLVVAGCETNEIKRLFVEFPEQTYSLIGWGPTESFLEKIDVLIHPARTEPFGMVIAEANAAGIPVVISNHCGIASMISTSQGRVCKLDKESFDSTAWANACLDLLNSPVEVLPLGLSWNHLASQHIEIYRGITEALTND